MRSYVVLSLRRYFFFYLWPLWVFVSLLRAPCSKILGSCLEHRYWGVVLFLCRNLSFTPYRLQYGKKFWFDFWYFETTRRTENTLRRLASLSSARYFYFILRFHFNFLFPFYFLRSTTGWSPLVCPNVPFPARGGFLGGRAKADRSVILSLYQNSSKCIQMFANFGNSATVFFFN